MSDTDGTTVEERTAAEARLAEQEETDRTQRLARIIEGDRERKRAKRKAAAERERRADLNRQFQDLRVRRLGLRVEAQKHLDGLVSALVALSGVVREQEAVGHRIDIVDIPSFSSCEAAVTLSRLKTVSNDLRTLIGITPRDGRMADLP